MATGNLASFAASWTLSFSARTKPLLLSRCWALLIASASLIAALPVAVVSFGAYGAALLLPKIPPLHAFYDFLSRSYDRLLARIAPKVLRDTRDAPALRLMVSLTLTVVPIFVLQLMLGKPRLLLAAAFYLALYGVKFQ